MNDVPALCVLPPEAPAGVSLGGRAPQDEAVVINYWNSQNQGLPTPSLSSTPFQNVDSVITTPHPLGSVVNDLIL